MDRSNLIRDRIVETLQNHPEGLPILAVAALVGAHRHTVTKYIYEMMGANVVRLRLIGSAKVCFLADSTANPTKEAGS